MRFEQGVARESTYSDRRDRFRKHERVDLVSTERRLRLTLRLRLNNAIVLALDPIRREIERPSEGKDSELRSYFFSTNSSPHRPLPHESCQTHSRNLSD